MVRVRGHPFHRGACQEQVGWNRRDYRQLEVGRLEFRRPLFQTSPQLVQRQ